VGRFLGTRKHRGQNHLLVEVLGVGERTLRNWKSGATHEAAKIGRPAHTQSEKYQALLAVRRQVEVQGWTTGWRPVDEVLALPTRLIQPALSAWKARHRKTLREMRSENRVSLKVLAKDVIWTEDAAHLGRTDESAYLAEVVKDRGSLATKTVAVGGAATGKDVVNILEGQKRLGDLPLVLATDNGPAYKSHKVAEFCESERIVHLFSRPRLPQDNGAAERGIGELKAESGLGDGVHLRDGFEAASRLVKAWHLLDHRPRACRGYQSAVQLEKSLPVGPDMVSREQFYEDACRGMEKAVQGGGTARQQRWAQRMAVYETLEKLNLVSIVRGEKTCRA
jgi:hypothetical protein